MQISNFRRALRVLALPLALALTACSTADDPYSKIEDGPLVPATLHAVTLLSDGPALLEQAQKAGYTPLALAPNYQAAIHVQSVQWNVPEEVAGKAVILRAPPGAGPDLRVLVSTQPPAAAAPAAPADPVATRAFYRNVLGADVPRWPDKLTPAPDVRVQVWTFLIADVVEARKKLRAHLIPMLTEPVHITTTYLGDEKSLTLRAPDGAIVELVQAVTQ
jgi:hypothetical protein